MSYFDPRTKECELNVQKIIHLQRLVNQLPDTFTNSKKVIKSHVPAANAPIKVGVPVGQTNYNTHEAWKSNRFQRLKI